MPFEPDLSPEALEVLGGLGPSEPSPEPTDDELFGFVTGWLPGHDRARIVESLVHSERARVRLIGAQDSLENALMPSPASNFVALALAAFRQLSDQGLAAAGPAGTLVLGSSLRRLRASGQLSFTRSETASVRWIGETPVEVTAEVSPEGVLRIRGRGAQSAAAVRLEFRLNDTGPIFLGTAVPDGAGEFELDVPGLGETLGPGPIPADSLFLFPADQVIGETFVITSDEGVFEAAALASPRVENGVLRIEAALPAAVRALDGRTLRVWLRIGRSPMRIGTWRTEELTEQLSISTPLPNVPDGPVPVYAVALAVV
jgi:hypothetical protein